MYSGNIRATLLVACIALLSGCKTTGPEMTFDDWQEEHANAAERFGQGQSVKIDLNWSRVGPFSRYETLIQANALGGFMDIRGAQACLGKFVRNDRLLPANGWWEIICADDSYAAGNFQLTMDGHIQATGVDILGEEVSFALPVPN